MEHFNFRDPAELYAVVGRGVKRRSMSYQRFASSAQAIKFAVEVIGTGNLWGTVIEIGARRLEGDEINALYRSEHYPLHRIDPPDQSENPRLPDIPQPSSSG